MRLSYLLAPFALLLIATTARADTFNFSTSNPYGASASGTFTATEESAGTYLVTSITGITDGLAITGLLDVDTFGGNDNLLFFPGTPANFFDVYGISFMLSNGSYVNMYDDSYYQVLYISFPPEGGDGLPGGFVTTYVTAATPEPSSIALLGSGLIGIAGLVRRRFTV